MNRITTRMGKGKKVTYEEQYAYCTGCVNKMHVAKIMDENLGRLEARYYTHEE